MSWLGGAGARLRSLVCLGVLPAGVILYSGGAVIAALAGASRSHLDRYYQGFARLCMRVGGTRLEVRGIEKVKPDQAYIVVPNHESNWDPPSLICALSPPLSLRFIVKRQIMAIPVFGQALRRTGSVRVERTNTAGDIERIRAQMAARPLEVSVLFYAEGTRSRDGALHPFRKGAFVTAIGYGLPVLPVGHAGCRAILSPGSIWVRPGPVVVEVGEPIPVAGLELADRDRLRDQAHEAVRALRARARTRVRELGGDPGGID
ncbi:MAG: lysophospholipid acyltransferase family protein [Myxococcota bacterium]